MKVHEIKRSQLIAKPLEEVFSFFERPENLSRITPPSMGFEILTPRPIVMKPGALIDYTVRVMGMRTRWTTLISDYDPPNRFVDIQLRGPYSFWHHTHSFRDEMGQTRIDDHVRYVMPFGFVGELVHRLFVGRQLRGIFDFRLSVLEDLFDREGVKG